LFIFRPRQLASALSQRNRIRFVARRGFAAAPTPPPSAVPHAPDANADVPNQTPNSSSAAAPPAAAAAPQSKPAPAPVAGPSLLHGIARGVRYVFDAIVGNERRDYQVSRNVALRPLPADTPAAESSALAVFQKPMTPWERQWRDKKERLESSAIYQSLEQGIKGGIRRVAQSENIVVKSAVEANRSLQNKIEDMREEFETSQDPSVHFFSECAHTSRRPPVHIRHLHFASHHVMLASLAFTQPHHPPAFSQIVRAREMSDSFFSESETGAAVGEVRKTDPDFSIRELEMEMQEYMLPIVLKSYLASDIKFMASIMDDTVRHVWR
jgi:hypothetical protein